MKLSLVANNAVDYLNKDTIENLQIPLPPIEIQNHIVAKMDEALAIKQQKEAEAKALLASVDEFVLGELGIEWKAVEERKIFGLKLSELGETKRFDPLNFQKKDKYIEKTKYQI
ncbi:MAG: restriction endonuclease subunit S [Rickettsiales bacterium]|jgi:restriction endonuclease S subunit|nr:restriction endonuclease subunit S [Rickettsiales bacterium]